MGVETSEINKQCRYNWCSAKELIGLFKETKTSESSLYSNCQMRYLNEVSPMLYKVTGTGHSMCVCGRGGEGGGWGVSVCVCVCVCVWERRVRRSEFPVFSVMVLDLLMPTRTASGLPVRKSNSQLHREVLSPSWTNLWVSCWGMIVLKCWTEVYEQHSDIQVFFCPDVWGLGGGQWRRLDRYANWKGSREGGRTDLMWCMTSRSKHFMRIGVSVNGR